MPQMKSEHLGDGVYVSQDTVTGDVIFTSGHHSALCADNVVYLEYSAIPQLVQWLQKITGEKS